MGKATDQCLEAAVVVGYGKLLCLFAHTPTTVESLADPEVVEALLPLEVTTR